MGLLEGFIGYKQGAVAPKRTQIQIYVLLLPWLTFFLFTVTLTMVVRPWTNHGLLWLPVQNMVDHGQTVVLVPGYDPMGVSSSDSCDFRHNIE